MPFRAPILSEGIVHEPANRRDVGSTANVEFPIIHRLNAVVVVAAAAAAAAYQRVARKSENASNSRFMCTATTVVSIGGIRRRVEKKNNQIKLANRILYAHRSDELTPIIDGTAK